MTEITMQHIHQYNKLIQLGLVKKIKCPMDLNHTDMISQFDFEENKPYYVCIACNTKIHLGHNLITKIVNELDKFYKL
jgi:hypothetical protein